MIETTFTLGARVHYRLLGKFKDNRGPTNQLCDLNGFFELWSLKTNKEQFDTVGEALDALGWWQDNESNPNTVTEWKIQKVFSVNIYDTVRSSEMED